MGGEDRAGGRSGDGAPDVEAIIASLTARRPQSADAPAVSAWMLGVLGVLHAPVYRSRELRARFAEVGVEDPMAAYLAQRSAPLGAAGAELVTAVFYGFAPQVVAAHVPAVWDRVSPERVVALTLEAMDELFTRVLGGREQEVAALAEALAPVAAAQPTAGRPLAAAWASVPVTGVPALDLWLATCVIRESRGDGHVALLVSEGVGPLESHLVTHGNRPEARPMVRAMRGWTEQEIDDAVARLRERGLLDGDGLRTDAARVLRARIERRTDELSAAPWESAGVATVDRVAELALALLPPVLVSGTLLPPVLARLAPPSTTGGAAA